MNAHNLIRYEVPYIFLVSPMIGSIIAGLFTGIDSALAQERKVILRAMQEQTFATVSKKFFSVTQKFTVVSVTASIFVAIVIILVFSRDIEWLANNVQNANAIHDATMSVIAEVFFIILVLIILIVNLIVAYSRNLKLLFNNETEILIKVSEGDLSTKVPIATQDEFGFIASHTNHMIDGLRHRFELINSLKLAEEVQQNLLPDASPYLKGFDISGTSVYCDQTGGDYYDYFLLPQQTLGVVVADAVGHGVGAAILMTSVRAFLTSAIQRYTNPATLITEVNHYISGDCSKSGRFTSLFFMEIDPDNRALKWVRAGHEPPLFYHTNTDLFSQLDGSGLVLGVDSNYNFEENVTEDLVSGDIILIGTDGISEARNQDGEFFGRERIQNCIRHLAQKSAKEIQVALLKELNLFCANHKIEDDITLVLIKVTS
ncbi:MAG: sigma-B regulation protein RsbU (phosphoserine phosphatase) [Desulforhopalus sp.]|jgi:sigma-B regulation protein RsbU (phosphoserine phosphatase)